MFCLTFFFFFSIVPQLSLFFYRFCFDDSPVGPRKKIAVSLNMNDIMSKIQ